MTKEDVTYRVATMDDLPYMVAFWIDNALHHSALEPRFQYASDVETTTRTFFSKQLQSENFFAVIAQVGDDVIGYVAAFVMERPPIHLHRKLGFIEGLFVKPEFRRKGIGRGLCEKALSMLQEYKIALVHLTVASKNPDATKFWRKLGFEDLMVRMELGLTREGEIS